MNTLFESKFNIPARGNSSFLYYCNLLPSHPTQLDVFENNPSQHLPDYPYKVASILTNIVSAVVADQ